MVRNPWGNAIPLRKHLPMAWKHLWFSTFCMLFFSPVSAQEWGLGFGGAFVVEHLPEGYGYRPWQLLGHYGFRPFLQGRKTALRPYAEPQLVLAPTPDAGPSFEGGLNLGLQGEWQLDTDWRLQAAIGSGPHFLGLRTELQARGFIFSDNFTLRCARRLPSKWQLTCGVRFRHISNAGFQNPNKGIDNWFLLFGFRKAFSR